MEFDIITIFPGIFDSYFSHSILERARKNNIIGINIHDLRDFTDDARRTVDDTPYGGGPGMILKVEPIYKAIRSIVSSERLSDLVSVKNTLSAKTVRKKVFSLVSKNSLKKTRIILFSAKGKQYTQEDAKRLARYEKLILICGRYEGVDERVSKYISDEEMSIGDYVLTGGEIPAMVVVDSVTRLLPGVLGNSDSAKFESHSKTGYLEYPQYTKPDSFMGWKVPPVLVSGNHQEIEKWRQKESVIRKNEIPPTKISPIKTEERPEIPQKKRIKIV